MLFGLTLLVLIKKHAWLGFWFFMVQMMVKEVKYICPKREVR